MAGARKKGYKAPDRTFTVLERWAFLTCIVRHAL